MSTAVPTGFRPLRVLAVEPLAEDAVTVTFEPPGGAAGDFAFTAGQHLVVRREVDGTECRRTYSLCVAEQTGRLQIGVRRIEGGVVSTWLTEQVRPGDRVEVAPPTGQFGRQLSDPGTRHIGLVAVGSGITPLIALAATHLRRSPEHRVSLVVGNRTTGSTMFTEELAALKDEHLERLHLTHVLSREGRSADLLDGRIDEPRMTRLLTDLVDADDVDHWFLCGPVDAVTALRSALLAHGVAADRVHREIFHADPAAPAGTSAAAALGPGTAAGTHLEVLLNGRSTVLRGADLTGSVLDALLERRNDAPFSCRNGVCGTCKARCVEGEVAMASTWALDEVEIADGVVLTCQATPVSDRVRLEFL